MFRLSGIFSILLAVGCGTLLFWTSQSVQRAENKLSNVNQTTGSEKESLRVLTAEWDYLNRPERLESLTFKNLDLDAQLVSEDIFVEEVEEIPEPIVPVIPKQKPKDLLRFVSTVGEKKAIPKKVKTSKEKKESYTHLSPIIADRENNNFDSLLNDVATGAGE